MESSFFYSNNCSRSVLAKNWRLRTQLAASACKICYHVAMSSIVPAHFPNKMPKGRQLNSQKHVKTAFYTPPACLLSCNQVATSLMQIVPAWLPVACKLYSHGRQSHANFGQFYLRCLRLAATRVQFRADWRPLGYDLFATGRQSHANFACASGQLRASRQIFANYLN
jgi:hypothetical protein